MSDEVEVSVNEENVVMLDGEPYICVFCQKVLKADREPGRLQLPNRGTVIVHKECALVAARLKAIFEEERRGGD